jgi:hypothetical protein
MFLFVKLISWLYILDREPTLFANIGCSSIVLTAQQSGDTKVRISIDNLSAVIQISSFPPLQVSFVNIFLLNN